MTSTERTLALLAEVAGLAAGHHHQALYLALDRALDELVGYKLLTVLRVQGPWLVRLHSSDEQAYPAGGAKDLRDDPWLQAMLAAGTPVLSADAQQVRARFPDHDAIFAMGCSAVLNVPVRSAVGTLGSLNLLHDAHRYTAHHQALAQAFAPLLGLAWLAQDLQVAQGP